MIRNHPFTAGEIGATAKPLAPASHEIGEARHAGWLAANTR